MGKTIVDEDMRFNIIVNGNSAQKDLYDLEKATKDVREETKLLKVEKAKLEAQNKKGSVEWKNIDAKIKANNKTLRENATEMRRLQDQIGITGLTLRQLGQKATFLKFQLANMIPNTPDHKRLAAELEAVKLRIKEVGFSARQTEGSLSRVANSFNKYQALALGIVASLTGVVLSMQKIIDYNGKLSDAQSDVMKTTGLSADEVDRLSASFGALKTRTTRIELLELAEEAGRLGIEGTANIKAFVEQANKMKVALGDDLSTEQIREVGKMVSIYKVGEETSKDFAGAMDALGSAINQVSASGANQAGFLVEYLKRQAGIAAQTKLSAADNLGYAATFDEVGQSVEVSATAMNKVFIDMFSNTAEYAKIAGMGVEDFSKFLQTDANEAMIRFLKGLNGNNQGLQVMVQKMEELDAGGTRGVQALAALASNTDLLRKRQEQANLAQTEAISLTDEYNLKNNNLAAIIEKVSKRFQGMLAGKAVTNMLTGLTLIFGRLIGAIQDVNKEFENETKASYASAVANRKLANESQVLLDRYEELTADGVEPTAEAKEELDIITLKLKDRLGESVMAIDKETGAYILNTEAVRNQIKMKRLAADEEASTLASRLVGVKEEQKLLAVRQRDAQKEFETRKKQFDKRFADDIKEIKNARDITEVEKQKLLQRLDGYNEVYEARSALNRINTEIEEQLNRELDLTQKLKDLNFSPEDANNMISPPEEGPKEGDTKTLGGETFIFRNGKWELVTAFTPSSSTGGTKKKAEKDESIEILRQNLLLKAQLIDDAFLKELAVYDVQHDIKMKKLRDQLVTEGKLTADQIKKNAAIEEQLLLEQELYEKDRGTFIIKGLSEQFKAEEDNYQRQKTLRQTKFAEEMAAYRGNEQAQKELRELHQKEELEAEAKHLEELIRQFNFIMNEGSFGGFDLEVLTPEQKAEMEKMLDDIKLKLAEVAAEKANLSGSGESDGLDLGTGGKIDIFGFSAQDWVDTFTNLDTVESKINAAGQAVQGFLNAWSTYYQYVNDNENRHLRQFERNQNKERTKLKNNLDSKLINQRQYDQGIAALEADMDKRKADLEYKQAKRAWKMQLANAIATAAMATLNGFNSTPFLPVGLIMGALAATLGTIQVGIIAKNKPVRGYESGYYPDTFPVEREQDGKIFNARYGGKPQSGMVKDPTILVGEMPELIISNPDLKKFNPEVTASIGREIRRVRGYESGYTSPAVKNAESPSAPSQDNTATNTVLVRVASILERLDEKGVTAYLVRDMENAKKMQDDLDKLKKYKQKSQV
ncbi:MAG TPA: phage tail tape measure protein [Aequorivita sp.]|nr:phage tail tape measure protein [Aequorivita sp.]